MSVSCLVPGLLATSFLGSSTIHEVQCTDEGLPSDQDMLSLLLYRVQGDKVLGFVNLKNRECATSDVFVSCYVDATGSRKTRLKALISDLVEGEARHYGCNVTTMQPGGRTTMLSWSIVIHQTSEYGPTCIVLPAHSFFPLFFRSSSLSMARARTHRQTYLCFLYVYIFFLCLSRCLIV